MTHQESKQLARDCLDGFTVGWTIRPSVGRIRVVINELEIVLYDEKIRPTTVCHLERDEFVNLCNLLVWAAHSNVEER